MKLFILFSLLVLIKIIESLRNKNKFEDYIVKVSEDFYKKHEKNQNITNFHEIIFKQIEQNEIINKKLNQLHQHIRNETKKLARRKTKYDEDMRIFSGDYYSYERLITLNISANNPCSIKVNDTVFYKIVNDMNFVEHMILHNNVDSIIPLSVFSENITVNYFAFNKKLNIFSVYFNELPHNSTKDFLMTYIYEGKGLIKVNKEQGDQINEFIFKLLNQNFLKYNQKVTITINFEFDNRVDFNDFEFTLNFTKKEANTKSATYEWKGELQSQEVAVVKSVFPLLFEGCGNITISLYMILGGALFIIFLVVMLYCIIGTVFFETL